MPYTYSRTNQRAKVLLFSHSTKYFLKKITYNNKFVNFLLLFLIYTFSFPYTALKIGVFTGYSNSPTK